MRRRGSERPRSLPLANGAWCVVATVGMRGLWFDSGDEEKRQVPRPCDKGWFVCGGGAVAARSCARGGNHGAALHGTA